MDQPRNEPKTAAAPARTDDGKLVCAGCLQVMDSRHGIFDNDDPDLAWHDPGCAAMWANREGLA